MAKPDGMELILERLEALEKQNVGLRAQLEAKSQGGQTDQIMAQILATLGKSARKDAREDAPDSTPLVEIEVAFAPQSFVVGRGRHLKAIDAEPITFEGLVSELMGDPPAAGYQAGEEEGKRADAEQQAHRVLRGFPDALFKRARLTIHQSELPSFNRWIEQAEARQVQDVIADLELHEQLWESQDVNHSEWRHHRPALSASFRTRLRRDMNPFLYVRELN